MMARKLSLVAAFLFPLSGIAAALNANSAYAEGEIKVTRPSPVVQNPHVINARPTRLPKHAQPTGGKSVRYRNPFATRSTMPPLDTRLLPSPLSRWQKSAPPVVEESAVKAAILSVAPNAPIQFQAPTPASTGKWRTRRDPSNTETELRVASRSDVPPDPVAFAAEPLAQPVWLTAGTEDARSRSPLARADFARLFSYENSASPPSSALQALAAEANVQPLISPQPADSADHWFAEAQQAAEIAQSVDDLSSVVDLCQRALSANPAADLTARLRSLAAWAHNRRGELRAEADHSEEALRDFDAAISLDPTNSLAIHNRAVTRAQQEDFAAALSDFDRVIELNPGLAIAHRNRAELLAAHGSMDEAIEDYTRAIEGLPQDAELRRARAHVWQQLGDSDRAREELNRAIELAPNEPQSYVERGNLLARQGSFEQALRDFRQAIAIDPNLAEANRSLAWLLATCPDDRLQDAQQALAAAEKAARNSPAGDYLALDVLAAAFARAGHFENAIATQQQALAAAPDEFAEPLRRRLALYQQGQAFCDDASGQAANAR